MLTHTAANLSATQRAAQALAALLEPRDLVVLSGDLGAGKTAFVQALARALGITAPVTSPTYAIARVYEGPVRLHHLDVYRLGDADELMDLDLPAMVEEEAVTLIEWGERFGDDLPAPWLWIRLDHDDADFDRRILTFEDVGGAWTARLPRLATLLAAPEA